MGGCASLRGNPDAMCSEIAGFANANPVGQPKHVELITDWGSRFSENKDSLFTKNCQHDGYAPAIAFCSYLMSNTSTEFATINLGRVSACLWPGTKGGPSDTDIDHLSLRAWSYSAKGVDPEIRIGVEFSTESDTSAPTLKIMAERKTN